MTKKEQSFADEFRDFVRERACSLGRPIRSFSLDGQDRDVGADYVFTGASQFALVEFKYEASDLVSEAHKPRRLSLCTQLPVRKDMMEYHDLCHFIAWSVFPKSLVNVYRKEICNTKVFGAESKLRVYVDQSAHRIGAGVFVDRFLTGANSLSLAEFNEYLEWVIGVSGGSGGGAVSLLARDPNRDDLLLVKLSSVTAAHDFVQKNWPSPAPFQGPSFSP